MAVPNLVIGTDTLGMGYNPFNQQCAKFNFSSMCSILNVATPDGDSSSFPKYQEATESGGMWTDSGTGDSYYVPPGLKLITSTAQSPQTATVSETITDFTYQLALKGGMAGIVGACSGSSEVTWSRSQSSVNENYYSFYDAEVDRYTLAFDPAEINMSGGLTTTVEAFFREAASNLPESFVSAGPDSNVSTFQSFFAKWGSHIVTGVTIGGRVRFTITIKKSDVSSSMALQTFIDAEYTGISSKGSASDQSGYEHYQSNRISNSYSNGGDPGAANALYQNPSADNYTAWEQSVTQNQVVIAVALKGLWNVPSLFGTSATSQMQALQDAFNYFSLGQAAVPFYNYTTTDMAYPTSNNITDYFYTTLENPESLSAYEYVNIPFYVLPQDPNNSLNLNEPPYNAIRLNRLKASKNDHAYHFYTTDPGKSGYSIESEYSQVPPAPTNGGNPPFANMVAVYRYKQGAILKGSYLMASILIHKYTTEASNSDDCEGIAFYAFTEPPGDPFQQQ